MIINVEIQNFRSIRHVSDKLDYLTVFIGGNLVGKTSILDAIADIGFHYKIQWTQDVPTLKRKMVLGGHHLTYTYNETLIHVIREFGAVLTRPVYTDARIESFEDGLYENVLDYEGFKYLDLNILNHLKDNAPELYGKIVDSVTSAGVDVNNNWSILYSSATTRFIKAITALHLARNYVLLDNPTDGWGSAYMDVFVHTVKEMTDNKELQVLIATHDPRLLQYMQPDNIRIVKKQGEHTLVERVSDDVRSMSSDYDLGWIWTHTDLME